MHRIRIAETGVRFSHGPPFRVQRSDVRRKARFLNEVRGSYSALVHYSSSVAFTAGGVAIFSALGRSNTLGIFLSCKADDF